MLEDQRKELLEAIKDYTATYARFAMGAQGPWEKDMKAVQRAEERLKKAIAPL